MIDAKTLICHYGNLKKLHVDNLKIQHRADTCGIWIWGPPGSGKTHMALHDYGNDIYMKP